MPENQKEVQIQKIRQSSERLVSDLKRLNRTITAVESCTGGMVAASLTSVAGSSSVFQRSFVTYCDQAKHDLAGVRKKTLRRHTAVSPETAAEMAKGGARRAKADICISVTGYAGPPSGDESEEAGLVYIGCRCKKKTKVKEFHFDGDREAVRLAACVEALAMAEKALKKWETH